MVILFRVLAKEKYIAQNLQKDALVDQPDDIEPGMARGNELWR